MWQKYSLHCSQKGEREREKERERKKQKRDRKRDLDKIQLHKGMAAVIYFFQEDHTS
jgi:hypothetical protein